MRVSKFLTIVFSITAFSLLYVYQQTEIFRLAYVGQKKQAFYEDLLDKNSILRYNMESNASLVHIGSKISGSADFQMPDSYRLISLAPRGKKGKQVSRQTIISRVFGVKSQAEAKTIP